MPFILCISKEPTFSIAGMCLSHNRWRNLLHGCLIYGLGHLQKYTSALFFPLELSLSDMKAQPEETADPFVSISISLCFETPSRTQP